MKVDSMLATQIALSRQEAEAMLVESPRMPLRLVADADWSPSSRSYASGHDQGRGKAFFASAVAVGVLFSAMVAMNVAPELKHERHVVTMDLSVTPPPPPPQSVPQPEAAQTAAVAAQAAAPVEQVAAPVAPVSLSVEQPSAPVAAPQPIAPAPVVAAAPAAPARPAGPAEGGDLSAKMVSFVAPSYPLESRRKREEGTVVLSLLLSAEGRVADISVSSSSGFARLDNAALEAVRKWRWSPLMRDGQAVMVRGLVRIPFVIKA
ncbi:energy transducer TonB [Novosphingobium umbonatum]|uniref:Protein TonB n=1 Tax=Novosphingobium umbonatum TaxID=1908524 RepID=A0A3S2Y509_9SPHN|nr:energy transducer TonB [Novosphingobium umbonatum]RVU03646.1 energy transducer TonB [Novosphingobium umbonatum]